MIGGKSFQTLKKTGAESENFPFPSFVYLFLLGFH